MTERRPLHILYIIDSLAPGGAETSLAAMAPHFIAAGIQLDVAYFKEVPGVHDRLTAAGAKLIHLGEAGGRLGRIKAVRKLIRAEHPDLVHTTLFEADIAGRVGALLARTPVVSSLVNTPYGAEHRAAVPHAWKLRLAHILDAATSRTVRRFHANSHDTAAVMARRLLIRPSKIDVVHRGRSAELLGRRNEQRRQRIRQQLGLDPSLPIVLSVARHDHAKGLDVLVRAVPLIRRLHPDVVVLIAGRNGPHTNELETLRDQLDPSDAAAIRLLGHRDDIADLLTGADVLAFPSRKEGLPGTLIEALALECPIVATDLASIREVVGAPPIALLVPPDDATALAGAISAALDTAVDAAPRTANATALRRAPTAISDESSRQRPVSDGRERFEQFFTVEQSSHRMVAFYDRALRRGRERR